MQRWTSKPLPLPADPQAPYARVDLELEGVRQDGSSYVALVYLNNKKADESSGRDPAQRFAAGFSVFAHGICWGTEDHCAVPDRDNPFDVRQEHRLTPQNVTLDVTDAVKQLGEVKRLEVTIVAVATDDSRKPLRFDDLTLVTYE
jgi:hypothetical protein